MPHFVYDTTALAFPKTNLSVLPPGALPQNYLVDSDWNEAMQAALDLRDVLKNGKFLGFQEQAVDPVPAGVPDYLWLSTAGLLNVKKGASPAYQVVPSTRQILTAAPLLGGATLVGDISLSLAPVAPDPTGVYTRATVTVDQYGRVISASSNAGSGIDTIVNDATPVTARTSLRVDGSNLVVTDDPGNAWSALALGTDLTFRSVELDAGSGVAVSAAAKGAFRYNESVNRFQVSENTAAFENLALESDARFTDDRTASGLRSATTVVSVSAATAPSNGQVLTATSDSLATWQTLPASVAPTRDLAAGAGLTGGGDLSADRTFTIGANGDGSITVNANDIQVGVLASDTQHGARGGGTQHAVVVAAGAAGFMSGADKTKLDNISGVGGGSLDYSYDFGGAGAGRTITADSGEVDILVSAIGAVFDVGLSTRNTTAAALNAQQYSPALILEGSQWEAFATTSYVVGFGMQVRPIQSPGEGDDRVGSLAFLASRNGSAYTDIAELNYDIDNGATSSGCWRMNDGVVDVPPYSFVNAPNSGMWLDGSNLAFSRSGNQMLTLTTIADFNTDIDALGGFRQQQSMGVEASATDTTYTPEWGAQSGAHDEWVMPHRAGSIVGVCSWAHTAVAGSDTVAFWVQKSTNGGATFSDLWGSQGSPIHSLNSTDSRRKATTAVMGTHTFASGDILRIQIRTGANWTSNGLGASLVWEC